MKKTILTLFVLSLLGLGVPRAFAAITRSLDLGDRGSDVTELQTYLAANPSLYPEGLITGYFGALTQAAVRRFQAAEGIVSAGTPATTGYGRVGPQTIARLNILMSGGGQAFDTPPILSSPSVQVGNTQATITWTTNEPTQGQVYWSPTPLQFNEATGPRQQPYVSGTLVLSGTGLQAGHSATIQNLQPNTTYYYLVRNVDNEGSMSMVWPRTFKTNF